MRNVVLLNAQGQFLKIGGMISQRRAGRTSVLEGWITGAYGEAIAPLGVGAYRARDSAAGGHAPSQQKNPYRMRMIEVTRTRASFSIKWGIWQWIIGEILVAVSRLFLSSYAYLAFLCMPIRKVTEPRVGYSHLIFDYRPQSRPISSQVLKGQASVVMEPSMQAYLMPSRQVDSMHSAHAVRSGLHPNSMHSLN